MKTNIKIYQQKELNQRWSEMQDEIIKSDGYLPDSILHDDLDKGMLEFITNNFKVISDGKQIPIIQKILTIQKWAEYTNTWEFTDDDKNIKLPFIAIVRKPDVQPGTNPITQRTIPNRKTFHYSTVKTWDGVNKGANIYKIPQPVAVDITFDVSIVCNKFRDLNIFNKIIMQQFSSRQSYTTVKGHYIPIVLDSNTDSTPMDLVDGRRFYIQNYQLTMLGFLIDSEEFEIKPAINKILLVNEFINNKKYENRVINNEFEIIENTLYGDGINKIFQVGKIINTLFYVTKNNILLTKDVDFYYIGKTSKINFITAPNNDDIIKIVYYNGKQLKDENGDLLILNEENITYNNNNILQLEKNIKNIICLSVNNQIKILNTYYKIKSDNQIELLISPSNNDLIKIIYLSV